MNDGEMVVGMSGYPDQPKQWTIVDYPASYHNGAGGLSFAEAQQLLLAVIRSGRTIVGFDLVEVAGQEWDANVGARLLHRLCGLALLGRGASDR